MAAGYSGTPQSQKLGLKPGQRVCVEDAPPGWSLANPPPDLVHVDAAEPADLVLAFFATVDEIARRLPDLAQRIYPAGALWIAWPRRAGGHHSDITENLVRERALPLGLVDVKVAAIDHDWSGLRVVWRLSSR